MEKITKNTIIFDLDGLLIDSEIISYQIYRDLLKIYDFHMSLEEYARNYSGKLETKNIQNIITTYQLPLSLEEGLAFVDKGEKEYFQQGVPLKKGARKLLSYLSDKKYKILLASSSTKERAIGILKQNGIENYFDAMVFGAEVKRGKPYPDIFLKSCECARENKKNCLVLEDSEAGIQAAYSAGIDVICIPDMKSPSEKFQKMEMAEFSSLEDVIFWLEEL